MDIEELERTNDKVRHGRPIQRGEGEGHQELAEDARPGLVRRIDIKEKCEWKLFEFCRV